MAWNNITVQPDKGKAMDLVAAFKQGKLLGYKFDVKALGALTVGDKIAVLDQNGWHVVTIDGTLKEDGLGIKDVEVATKDPRGNKVSVTVRGVRLIDSSDGKAGLVWDFRQRN